MNFTPLQNAALKRFASQGYAGTTLAQIAGDVGIKPPSIYAHFKNKEELFLSLLEPTIEEELAYARRSAADFSADDERLLSFLKDIEKRYESAPVMSFLLHAAYLPPEPLALRLDEPIKRYMESLAKIFIVAFKARRPGRLEPETLAAAYLGVVDSLQAEMLYGGRKPFRKRLGALWALLSLAL